jgi:hypothetical protein
VAWFGLQHAYAVVQIPAVPQDVLGPADPSVQHAGLVVVQVPLAAQHAASQEDPAPPGDAQHTASSSVQLDPSQQA